MEQDIVIRSAHPAEMPAVAAAYQWLFVPPGQRPPQLDEAKPVSHCTMSRPRTALTCSSQTPMATRGLCRPQIWFDTSRRVRPFR
jgi:hypothetical protein